MRIAAGLSLVLAACGAPTATTPEPVPAAATPAADPTAEWDEMFSEPEEYRERAVSAEAGRHYFMNVGVGDPYGAGIPYPLFLALLEQYPDKLGGDWNGFNRKFGTFFAPGDAAAELPVGFHLTRDPNTRVPFLVMNCQICHTDRIVLPDGPRLVPGMGSKRVRLHAYSRALIQIGNDPQLTAQRLLDRADRIARARGIDWPGDWRKVITAATVRALAKRAAVRGDHSERLGDELPGRVDTIAGFVMALNWQYDAGLELPPVRGWVKIPDVAVWRYRETNSFDAVGIGAPVAQVAGADFAFGVRPRWYDEHRHISTSMFLFLRSFERDLPYPGTVDRALARAGKALFDDACAACHGSYGDPARQHRVVSYHEKVVDIDVVGTDRARLDAVTGAFVDYANSVPDTRGLTLVRKTGGYVPRPLVDVWARGSYGHNGQWPSIAVLATPPAERPTRFVVDLDAPYDLANLGLRWKAIGDGAPALEPGQYVYDAAAPGYGVQGHTFLSSRKPAERAAIIEYLKTL